MVAAPFVLGAVGFTAVGITAGSWAAGMMSAAAVANGGAVAAGTTVAVLQSVGKPIICSGSKQTHLHRCSFAYGVYKREQLYIGYLFPS